MLLLIITGGVLLAFVCAVCGFKGQPRAYLTQEELDDARARKEGERESKIMAQMKRLEKRLKGSRMRKAALDSGQETEKLLEGKAVYGDQWDESVDGSIPMRDLFEMPENEIKELKIQAYNKVLHHKKQVEKTERIERETQRNKDLLAFNSARQQALGYTARNPIMKVEEGFIDPTFVDPSTSLMGVRRKHKPVQGADFHDPRFVSRATTSRPESNFHSRSEPPPQPSVPTRNPLSFPQPPTSRVELQAPGLKKPRPPSFVPSSPSTAAQAPAPAPTPPAPQVERQAAGLKNPKPPSFLPPPPSKKYEAPPPSPGDEMLAPVVKKKKESTTQSNSNPLSLSSLFSKMNNPNSVLPLHDIATDTSE